VLGGPVEQRLVTVELVDGQLEAGIRAQLRAERTSRLRGVGLRLRRRHDLQPAEGRGSVSGRAGVIGRGYAGKAKGHSREPPSEGERAPSFIGRAVASFRRPARRRRGGKPTPASRPPRSTAPAARRSRARAWPAPRLGPDRGAPGCPPRWRRPGSGRRPGRRRWRSRAGRSGPSRIEARWRAGARGAGTGQAYTSRGSRRGVIWTVTDRPSPRAATSASRSSPTAPVALVEGSPAASVAFTRSAWGSSSKRRSTVPSVGAS